MTKEIMTSEQYAQAAMKEKLRETLIEQFGLNSDNLTLFSFKNALDLLVDKILKSKQQQPNSQASIELLAQFGRTATPMRGMCWFSEGEVALDYDEVQYIFDPTDGKGNFLPKNKLQEQLLHHDDIINKHHKVIKEVYYTFNEHIEGDVWVLISRSVCPSVFFGDRDGYIASLYFNAEKSKRKRLSLHSENKCHNKLIKSLHGEKFVTKTTKFTG